MAVNLGQNGAELHLQTSYNDELAHAIANRPFFQVQIVHSEVIKGLIYAGGALFEHLHLLITKCHIMEHDEEMEFVSATRFKINDIHDTISFLQKVQSTLILFSLDESISAVVQLSQDNRDLVFRDAKLLVIVLIESVVFIQCA